MAKLKFPKFNKNLTIGILLLIIFILLGIFGCVSMTGGKYNPLCPPCSDTNTTPKPTLTPTPTPNEQQTPTPTPTDAPDVSCSDYSFNDCTSWGTSQEMTHFGLTTNATDCTNMGVGYCEDFDSSLYTTNWSQTTPVCCCVWKCSGE